MDQAELIKLFDKAIGREQEAFKFYSGVAEKVKDSAVKEVFLQLAQEEKGHEEALWKFKADPTASVKFKAPQDFKVAESVELPELSLDMKPAEAIALAMKKEQEAVELYQNLSDWSTDATLKDMYANLSNMEQGHKHRLEKLYVDIGYPEVW